MKPALIIIDIQNDYFPGGKMELEGSPEASLQAAKLLEAFRAKGLPLVPIQHVSNRPGASFLLPDTEGGEGRRTPEIARPAAIAAAFCPLA